MALPPGVPPPVDPNKLPPPSPPPVAPPVLTAPAPAPTSPAGPNYGAIDPTKPELWNSDAGYGVGDVSVALPAPVGVQQNYATSGANLGAANNVGYGGAGNTTPYFNFQQVNGPAFGNGQTPSATQIGNSYLNQANSATTPAPIISQTGANMTQGNSQFNQAQASQNYQQTLTPMAINQANQYATGQAGLAQAATGLPTGAQSSLINQLGQPGFQPQQAALAQAATNSPYSGMQQDVANKQGQTPYAAQQLGLANAFQNSTANVAGQTQNAANMTGMQYGGAQQAVANTLRNDTGAEQGDLANYLKGQAMGTNGPSAASLQLAAGADQATKAAASQAASAGPNDFGLARRGAIETAANLTQTSGNAAAQLRMQEMQNAQGQLGTVLGTQRGQTQAAQVAAGNQLAGLQNQTLAGQQAQANALASLTGQQQAGLQGAGALVNTAAGQQQQGLANQAQTFGQMENQRQAGTQLGASIYANQVGQNQAGQNLALGGLQNINNQTLAGIQTAGNLNTAGQAAQANAMGLGMQNQQNITGTSLQGASLGYQTALQNAGLQLNQETAQAGITQNQQQINNTQYQQSMAQLMALGLSQQEAQAKWEQSLNASLMQKYAIQSGAENNAAMLSQQQGQMDWQKGAQAVGTGLAIAGMAASDARLKTDVRAAGAEIDEPFLKLNPVHYRYKDEAFGAGPITGIMAQDMERSELGRQVVVETPVGKALDLRKAVSLVLASQARTVRRLAELEKR